MDKKKIETIKVQNRGSRPLCGTELQGIEKMELILTALQENYGVIMDLHAQLSALTERGTNTDERNRVISELRIVTVSIQRHFKRAASLWQVLQEAQKPGSHKYIQIGINVTEAKAMEAEAAKLLADIDSMAAKSEAVSND